MLAADRAKLLQMSLAFHDQHGEQRCPVCGQGTLDEHWAVAARDALQRDQRAVAALTAARAATQQARSALITLVRSVSRTAGLMQSSPHWRRRGAPTSGSETCH